MTKRRECKDCRAEGRTGPVLNAPYPGPRCHRHHLKRRTVTRERAAQQRREKTYGLSPERWEAILEVQGYCCGWCGRSMRKGGRRLAADHDHSCCPGHTSCGECTRGGLCWSCNKALEHFHDNPELIERGAEYLRNPPAKKVPVQLALL
jgi:Recombination endonuclease VII